MVDFCTAVLNYIKIDGLLVRDIAFDQVDQAAVRAIAQFAGALNALTIAESVENADAIEKLRDLGVTHAQGYGVGAPVPLQTLTKVGLPA